MRIFPENLATFEQFIFLLRKKSVEDFCEPDLDANQWR